MFAPADADEATCRAHLLMLRNETQAEVASLQQELELKHAARMAELRSRGEEERLQALEFEAQQRMFAVEQAMVRQAATARLREVAAARDAELDAKQKQV
jgi:hypothetical protein